MQYILTKIPINELIKCEGVLTMTQEYERQMGYEIEQGDSLLLDQIEQLRGFKTNRITELVLVEAKRNPKQEDFLRDILNNGFIYNNVKYYRFGKSQSQGKSGITGFVCAEMYDELSKRIQMDVPVDECVISKYESYRCLIFSSCTLIYNYLPNIVIIDEYKKVIPNQNIRYVVEREREYTDYSTGKTGKYKSKEIEESVRDIELSPFDGCGCHEADFMSNVSAQLGLDYNAAGVQVRMPFVKGYSVYVPFREIFREWGITEITDVFGKTHKVENIDCIWNISMFKGYKIFRKKYGDEAWNEYINTFKAYNYKLGISKYSHHVKNLNLYTRMNFQYLQCLDLWNDKYVKHFVEAKNNKRKHYEDYDILDPGNEGKIISIAKYTTDLYEKIITGNKFYTYKFMGIHDTEDYEPESIFLKAALINDVMLKDPAVKQFIYRKLQKSINEAKVGKIYCPGFYHTGVGDMIGYLQYAGGIDVVGCLKEREFYSGNLEEGACISFRSPLVDASEVNKVNISKNETVKRWFGHFKDQDIVMFNMYDISAPQQGGADFDGDIFYLNTNPVIINGKIDKNIVIDIEDKVTTVSKAYTTENITEYEVKMRDSRIGEITNVATSIENKYFEDDDTKKRYSDYTSLLRIYQGKEIDALKTGFRWHLPNSLRNHLKQLPYFLLYNYPAKMKAYQKIVEKNKHIDDTQKKQPLNVFFSPSPMNELCDYICAWEKRHIQWNNCMNDLVDTQCLIINNDLELNNKEILRLCKRTVNQYAADFKYYMSKYPDWNKMQTQELINTHKTALSSLNLDEETLANYVIKASYSSFTVSKSFCWNAYGDYILKNLIANTNPKRNISIHEVPYKTNNSYEYLGKYYEFEVGDSYVRL